MKKNTKIFHTIVVGIICLTIVTKLSIIGVSDLDKPSTEEKQKTIKENQISFLKKHESEMSDYIKSQKFYITLENDKTHPKVTNVSFDYDSYDTYQRDAGGIPYDFYTIDITGTYNNSEEFELLIDVDSLDNPTKILNFERY